MCSFDFSNLHALCLCLKITLNNIFKLLVCEKAKLLSHELISSHIQKIKFPFCSDSKQNQKGNYVCRNDTVFQNGEDTNTSNEKR